MDNHNKKHLTWRLYREGVDSVLEPGNLNLFNDFHNCMLTVVSYNLNLIMLKHIKFQKNIFKRNVM